MDREDILIWPDGEWCYREELGGYDWKSDDYRTIPVGAAEYSRLVESV